MEKISVVDYIKNLPFFEEFTESEKTSLLEKQGLLEEYQQGETIISQGAIESWLYVVLKGTVGLYKSMDENVDDGRISLKSSEEILVKKIEIGSIFGEISLITSRPRNVTARAASKDVSVIKITKEILEIPDNYFVGIVPVFRYMFVRVPPQLELPQPEFTVYAGCRFLFK